MNVNIGWFSDGVPCHSSQTDPGPCVSIRPSQDCQSGHHYVDDVRAFHHFQGVDDVFRSGQATTDVATANDHDLVDQRLVTSAALPSGTMPSVSGSAFENWLLP